VRDLRALHAAEVGHLPRLGTTVDAGSETLAEFVEEWWRVYAGPNLERATLWNGQARSRNAAFLQRTSTRH